MTTSDVKLMTELYEAFDRGDLLAIRPYIATDFVMEQPEQLPWSGRYYGPDGFFSFFRMLFSYVDATVQRDEIFDAGAIVVQIGYAVGTIRSSGAAFRAREIHLLTMRDSQLTRMQVLLELPVMLAALGG